MLFGAKSSPCTVLYIKNKNASLFLDKYPNAANSLVENCCMDDYLDSCESFETAVDRIAQVKEINAHANWEMHGWASNYRSILNKGSHNQMSNELISVEKDVAIEKILGLHWLNLTDELSFKINKDKITPELYNGCKNPTKREFLAVIMSIFDSLGFLTPFTIQSRVLMQQIWSSGINWDEQLRENEFLNWKRWLRELEKIKSCRIERCYQLQNSQQAEAELHIFCDASSKAYATVAYWRFVLPNNKFHVSIIMAKSRVAPLKVLTIPRLELQAVVLASRMAKVIRDEHEFKISKRVFWSDSLTVLHWIKKDPREFKVCVANRLREIRENTDLNEWKWISTKDNPADDGTRYAPNALDKGSRWLLGPTFLRTPESEWPDANLNMHSVNEAVDTSEVKKVVAHIYNEKPIIDFANFSSYNRLLSVVMRVLEAINRMRRRTYTPLE